MPKVTLPNGIVLDRDHPIAVSGTEYAKSRGLEGVTVYHSVDPEGHQEYLIVRNQEPEFASPSFEAIVARLEIMKLAAPVQPRRLLSPESPAPVVTEGDLMFGETVHEALKRISAYSCSLDGIANAIRPTYSALAEKLEEISRKIGERIAEVEENA